MSRALRQLGVAILTLEAIISACSAKTPTHHTLPRSATAIPAIPSAKAENSSSIHPSVTVSVSAGSKAREKIKSLLTGSLTNLQLVFLYFDLVVNGTDFHPGVCPHDGKSAADIATPLKWAVVRVPEGSSIHQQSNFAHAYLTLPLGYPRTYSLGTLDGDYVRYLSHEQHRMKIIVEVDQPGQANRSDDLTYWTALDSNLKAEYLRAEIRRFLSKLGFVGSNAGSAWHLCYSDPTKFISYSLHTVISLEHVDPPLYMCDVDQEKPARQLNGDYLFYTFFVLLVVMALWFAAIQAKVMLKGHGAIMQWGTGKDTEDSNEQQLIIDRTFLSERHLPAYVTIGGLIKCPLVLGETAFGRLLVLLTIGLMSSPIAMLIILSYFVLSPRTSSSHSSAGHVVMEDSFIYCEPYFAHAFIDDFSSRALTAATLIGCIMTLINVVLVVVYHAKNRMDFLLRRFASYLSRSSRLKTAPISVVILLLRVCLSWPSPSERKFSNDSTGRCVAVKRFLAEVLGWILKLFTMPFILCAGLVCELLLSVSTLYEYNVFFYCGMKNLFLRVMPGILCFAAYAYLYYLIAFESLSFFSLTFIGLFINYPGPFFTGVLWLLTSIDQLSITLESYRYPLLAVWKTYTQETRTALRDNNAFGPTAIPSEFKEGGKLKFPKLSIKFNSPKSTQPDFRTFLREMPIVYDFACCWLLSEALSERDSEVPAASCSCCSEFEASCSSHGLGEIDIISRMSMTMDEFQFQYLNPEERLRLILQNLLKLRLFDHVQRFIAQLVVFFTIAVLLVSFQHLFTSNLKSINNFLFQLPIIPMYAYYRSMTTVAPITKMGELHVEEIIKDHVAETMKTAKMVSKRHCLIPINPYAYKYP